jgi:glycosyltransferase involved in cell wall biosynthesis
VPDLSVVIPVYNEAGNVAPLAAEVRASLDGKVDYELVFVDDGSADATAAELDSAAARDARLRVVRHARNFGQSAAILTGVKAARAALVATLDGDGQNDPADLMALYETIRAAKSEDRLGMVSGMRVKRHDNWLRRVSSRIANGVRARALGDGALDTGCGLKVFRRDAFLALPRFDHMHRFLPALIQRDGLAVRYVPVGHRPRTVGRSKYGMLDRLAVGIVDLLGTMWLRRRALAPVTDGRE